MQFHDAYLRSTPVDLLFPTAGDAQGWVDDVHQALDEDDNPDLARFLGLPPVRVLLDRTLPADSDGSEEGPLGALAFFVHRALRSGEVVLAPGAVVDVAVADPPAPADPAGLWPEGAGYVQLPRHRVWVETGVGPRPSAVDGYFWFRPADPVLSILVVAGLLEGQASVQVVLVQDAPLADAAQWWDASMRNEGRDFESTLPGGEALVSLANHGEVLKLATRLRALPSIESSPQSETDPRTPASWLGYRVLRLAPP